MSRRHVAAALIVVVLAGCGSDPGTMTPEEIDPLEARVEAVRTAATEGDPTAFSQRIAELRTDVAQLHAEGRLPDDRATAISASITTVEQQFQLTLPTTTVAPTTAPLTTVAPTTEPPPPEPPPQGKKNKGRGPKAADDEDD